ncbi:hypothetical protein Nepgr_033612 [Nepenthes gracilis]|uniref:Uncharacterized protein n=1 Tax=Nepenthes gracilis TaxID=150966 RepID=A0AAD3Y726_NEPGR|nr:hypothetical protein Nepgr_033612 [Nepenthes gracilis]
MPVVLVSIGSTDANGGFGCLSAVPFRGVAFAVIPYTGCHRDVFSVVVSCLDVLWPYFEMPVLERLLECRLPPARGGMGYRLVAGFDEIGLAAVMFSFPWCIFCLLSSDASFSRLGFSS